MGRLINILSIFIMLSLTGCAQVDPLIKKVWPAYQTRAEKAKNEPTPGESEAARVVKRDVFSADELEADAYLTYYQEVGTLSAAAYKSQLSKAAAIYKKSRSTGHGILYALTLMAGPGDADNSNQALSILDELQNRILKTRVDTEQTALVHMLWKMVRTQVVLQAKTRRLESELGTHQERLVVLEDQINALKNIEKSIYEREIGIVSKE